MGSSASSIRAGGAFVEFFGKEGPLLKTMDKISKRMKMWGKEVTAVGTGVAGAGLAVLSPLLAAAKIFESTGSALLDMSARTGASVEALSSLGFAASQSGAALEDVETGIKKMSKFLFTAADGSKEAQQALRRLGLSLDQIAKMSPEDQFRLIGSRIVAIENPIQRAAMAMAVFGKTGTMLLPMLNDMAELEKRARELGIVMSREDAMAADRLGDSWGELIAVGKGVINQVGASLAPMLTSLITYLAEAGAGVIQWVRDNRELIVTIAKVAGIVVAIGAGIVILGSVIAGLGTIIGTVVGAIVGIFTAIAAVISFLLSPIGLVIAAVVGLTTAFFMFTDIGQQALAFMSDAFASFSQEAVDAWHGIRDAIGNGEIGKAFTVVSTFLSLQWAKVVSFLSTQWANFLNFMVPAAIDVAKRVANVFIDMALAIVNTFINMTTQLEKLLGKSLVPDNIKIAVGMAAGGLAAAAKVGIGNSLDAMGKRVTSGADDNAKAALDDADKARTAFDDAVADAKKKGKKFEAKSPSLSVPDLREGLDQAKAAVTGTFSATTAAGLGGNSDLSKVADNTDEMKTSLKKIAAKPAGLGVM